MSFNRTCENCERADWYDDRGEKRLLEVCHSDRHNQYRCKSCHFAPTEAEIRSGATKKQQ